MHTNYRRKNKFVGKKHNRTAWPLIYSLRSWRKLSWRRRRSAERMMVHEGRFDGLPQHYYEDIYWHYW